jgi:hypothetical protein
VVEFFRP